ncbi:hypothetical protein AZI98_13045 [Aeribacillus pallidus]|uniref:Uncharacterized protein n=1 Tax=Aeribacillus pallidus TaxID=33936 RepID=A0A165X4L9_9BACI|nr:hypothetical protein AZI98_13045 [Aeribacillus pallidus]
MDVKYIPSEWEKTKKGIGDLVGLGVWGKGMIDKLKDLNDLLEDVQADIAKYDTDGVISFTHTDRKKQYQQLYEDYLVLHRFSSRVGEIVDRTIDDPFYQEIDYMKIISSCTALAAVSERLLTAPSMIRFIKRSMLLWKRCATYPYQRSKRKITLAPKKRSSLPEHTARNKQSTCRKRKLD